MEKDNASVYEEAGVNTDTDEGLQGVVSACWVSAC